MTVALAVRRVPLRSAAVLSLFALTAACAAAQAPHPLTPAEQAQVESTLGKMSMDEKLAYIGGTGFAVRAMPALGLPALEMSDGPYGVRSNSGLPSTAYAAGIGLAASWDRDLAARVGAGIGRDARARGIHFMLGPGVNIYREPMNGRNFEYFGEDPYLAGEMAVGYIEGMQGQGVSATVKHYLANNAEYLRHDSNSVLGDRALREIYLPAFEAAVTRAHTGAVMNSYNLIDGQHATQNPFLNIQVLRKEWHFPGILMSDWHSTYDGVAAANGGLDLEMPTGANMNAATLRPALAAGTVTAATIDEKIRHLLTTPKMFGWGSRPQRDSAAGLFDGRNDMAALDSARESIVLLKNDNNLLPLAKAAVKTILVVGPEASPGFPVGGGSAGVVPFHTISALEGVAKAAGPGVTVLYDRGVVPLDDLVRQTQLMQEATATRPGVLLETFRTPEPQGAAAETRIAPFVLLDSMSATQPAGAQPAPAGNARIAHRFTGYYMAAAAETTVIVLQGSGEGSGNRVYVDGRLVIDNWRLVRALQPHVTLDLAAGPHKVVVEQWQTRSRGGRQLSFAMVPQSAVVDRQVAEQARKADVVLVEAGFDPASEAEGGDRTFALPYGQDELIAAVEAANPRTVVAVTSGGNVDSRAWLASTPALLAAWYGGQAGGQAQGEVLFGQVNPSGHLPVSFERAPEDNPAYASYYPVGESDTVDYKDGIFAGYRGYEHSGVKPLFPFGFGLSYTTFAFRNLKLSKGAGGTMANVEFDVTDTGPRAGATVAQVYVSEPHSRLPRPAHELKNFARVEVGPGATVHVSMPLDRRAFAYYDPAAKNWAVDRGDFIISVGDSVESLPLSGTVTLGSPAYPLP